MSIKKQIIIHAKLIVKHFLKLIKPKVITPKNRFSAKNYGIIERLEKIHPSSSITDKEVFINNIINVFGIQVEYPIELNHKVEGIKTIRARIIRKGVLYDESHFKSYDGVKIPLYIIYPPKFNMKKKYPTIIIFSGHGSATQVAFEEMSYQHACGTALSKKGFLVYIMENRGMGKLSYLGNHLRIDAVARITGGTWYGEIITDALWLMENLHIQPNVDISRIGTAGVSTGGAISMIVASLDQRIATAFIQGFLGSYRKTFGARGTHCLCGHIPGILKIGEMSDIASLIAPRPVIFVNGTADSFYASDAKQAFYKINSVYKNLGVENKAKFLAPVGVDHEFSVDIAAKWFSEQFNYKAL